MGQMLPNDLIGWIRQKLSKHQSYLKVKREKRSVKLNANRGNELFTSKNRFLKVKTAFKTARIADVINMTIWKQIA